MLDESAALGTSLRLWSGGGGGSHTRPGRLHKPLSQVPSPLSSPCVTPRIHSQPASPGGPGFGRSLHSPKQQPLPRISSVELGFKNNGNGSEAVCVALHIRPFVTASGASVPEGARKACLQASPDSPVVR
jgi:hypothetical protein